MHVESLVLGGKCIGATNTVTVTLPVPAVNLVNPIQPPANPQQNPPIPMAQAPFQMPL